MKPTGLTSGILFLIALVMVFAPSLSLVAAVPTSALPSANRDSQKTSPTLAPGAGATWESRYNSQQETYELQVDWLHIPGSRGYSVAISKIPGEDPGNDVITPKSDRYYPSIPPGVWYLNVKAKKSTGWGQVLHWEIFLPAKDPSKPTAESQVLGSRDSQSGSADGTTSTDPDEGITFVEPSPTEESSTGNPVQRFLGEREPSSKPSSVGSDNNRNGSGTGDQSGTDETDYDDRIAILRMQIEQLIAQLLGQSNIDATDLNTALNGVSVGDGSGGGSDTSSAPTPKKRYQPGTTNPSFVCDCTKRCREMSSCSEAYYQLHQCGCVNLDPSGDSIPCGKICPAE
jgi:hypothetical protein